MESPRLVHVRNAGRGCSVCAPLLDDAAGRQSGVVHQAAAKRVTGWPSRWRMRVKRSPVRHSLYPEVQGWQLLRQWGRALSVAAAQSQLSTVARCCPDSPTAALGNHPETRQAMNQAKAERQQSRASIKRHRSTDARADSSRRVETAGERSSWMCRCWVDRSADERRRFWAVREVTCAFETQPRTPCSYDRRYLAFDLAPRTDSVVCCACNCHRGTPL